MQSATLLLRAFVRHSMCAETRWEGAINSEVQHLPRVRCLVYLHRVEFDH
jgi:hypothetical protein